LRKGEPIDYIQADVPFRCVDVSYNTAAKPRTCSVGCWSPSARSSAFTIEPYQLGVHNDEGIASGACWTPARDAGPGDQPGGCAMASS
jgi:hypothetical protein